MPWTSLASKARVNRSTSSRSAAEPGAGGCSRSPDPGSWRCSVARARLRALVTDSSVESRTCATSRAWNPSTSRRISTARWRGGSSCNAVTKASETASRASNRASGPGAVSIS